MNVRATSVCGDYIRYMSGFPYYSFCGGWGEGA